MPELHCETCGRRVTYLQKYGDSMLCQTCFRRIKSKQEPVQQALRIEDFITAEYEDYIGDW